MKKYLITVVISIAVLLTVGIASANGVQGAPSSDPNGGQPTHNPSPDGGKGGIGGDNPSGGPHQIPSPDGGKGGIGGDNPF